jgi:hypothetical protein
LNSCKPPIGSRFYYGYIIVIASTLILIGALGLHYAFGVFFKPLISEFAWSRAVTSGAVSLSLSFRVYPPSDWEPSTINEVPD